MLKHLQYFEKAEQIERAILKTLSAGLTITADLGGHATTTEFTKAVIHNL
jgi:isocitrate dehydrogenase (NAD+)